MNKNIIYKYDIASIFKHGNLNKEDHVIEFINSFSNDKEEIDETYNDCLLFDQVRKVLPNTPLKEVFVLMDFNNFKKHILKLQNFDNGIKLNIDGQIITFELFIKSNSMSRSYECYYVNSEYKDLIYDRISFGFDVDRLAISKWSAYLGLTCSSATILNNIHIKEDEVLILEDKEETIKTNCITVISIRYLYNLLDKYINNLKNKKSSNNIKEELNYYTLSKDYDSLDNDIKTFINEFLLLFNMDKDKALIKANNIKQDYDNCKNNDVVWRKIEVNNYNININYYDGVGLISNELGEDIFNALEDENNELFENEHFSYQIRLPFLKGMVHTVDIQGFFKEHNIKKVRSVKNFKDGKNEFEYKDASKIKMIITESQFKASKYLKNLKDLKGCKSQINYYFKLLNKYDYPLGIANIETKEDKRGRLNYQFLTTLPLNNNDINHIIEVSKDEIRKKGEIKSIKEALKENEDFADYIMADKFRGYYLNTQRYKDKRKQCVNKEKSEALIGKIKCNSSRRYLAPDLLGLLYYSIDKEVPAHEVLHEDQFYAPLTNREFNNHFNNNKYDDTYGIILRNPHYSRNEIVVSKRCHNIESERDYYFNHLYGVLMVNPLSLYSNRLGGADYDGDSVLFIDDSYYAKNMYDRLIENNNFKYKLAFIPSLSEESSKVNYKTKINSLNRTFSNQTGRISNYAFIKNMDNYNDDNIYDELAYYTILSGLEIDSAKSGCKPVIDKELSNDNLFINIKEAIKKHDESSPYYFTNKKVIKEIEKNKDKHYLYKIQNEVIKYNPKEEVSLKPKDLYEYLHLDNNYDPRHRIEVFGLIDGYNNLMSKNKIYSIKSRIAFTNKDIIEDWIKVFVKDIDYLDFLNYFKTDNPTATLNIYCKNHYHFMNNKEDKINFIKNELNLSLPDNIIDIVTDFSDKKYLLLYISLLYWREISVINFKLDYTKLDCSKSIDKLSDSDKNVALSVRNRMMDYILNIHPFGEWEYKELIMECRKFIDTEYNDITFNDVSHAIDLKKDTVQFDLFNNVICRYYESGDDNE